MKTNRVLPYKCSKKLSDTELMSVSAGSAATTQWSGHASYNSSTKTYDAGLDFDL